MDAVAKFLPSPVDTLAIEGVDPRNDNTVVRHPSPDEPLCALAFKIATDPFVGRLCFFRVYSGELPAGSYVYNPRSDKKNVFHVCSRCTQINKTLKMLSLQEI